MTSAAPPTARPPKCTKCQSCGTPSTAEYWHMWETKIRFLNLSPRKVNSEKSFVDRISAGFSVLMRVKTRFQVHEHRGPARETNRSRAQECVQSFYEAFPGR